METSLIKDNLEFLNSEGILTINSQPAVNAALSTDPLIGWGGEGGYIYQKVCYCYGNTNIMFSYFLHHVQKLKDRFIHKTIPLPCYETLGLHTCTYFLTKKPNKVINMYNYRKHLRMFATDMLLYCHLYLRLTWNFSQVQ
jgi:hypothetical protein